MHAGVSRRHGIESSWPEQNLSVCGDDCCSGACGATRVSVNFLPMKRTLLFTFAGVLALALFPLPSHAQDWAKQKLEKSRRHGEWVTLKAGDRPVQAFIVYPESKSKTSAV